MGEIVEIKTLLKHLIPRGFGFFTGIHVIEDPSVLAKCVVDIPNKVVRVTVLFVVVGISTLI